VGRNGVGPREVADGLEVLCRKGYYYGLKVHFFGPIIYLRKYTFETMNPSWILLANGDDLQSQVIESLTRFHPTTKKRGG